MLRKEIFKIIRDSIKTLQKRGKLPGFDPGRLNKQAIIERPSQINHGDYSTNIAMVCAKQDKANPIEIANLLRNELESKSKKLFEKIEIAKPGFINFFISEEYLQRSVGNILKEKEKFNGLKIGKGQKINVEFISANPTGPLTLGNGRGGFCGDVLANILEKAGFKASREYYINDVGEQIRKLGHSIIGGKEAVYQGKYIQDLKKRIKSADPEKAGEKGAKLLLKETIKPAVKKMGIKFDVWFSEKKLYKNKEVDKILNRLKKKKLTYEKQGALWFRTTKFGDDKDRVLVKADNEKTYFASDIAYLNNKFKRGFKRLIFFWGADHYGYLKRIEAAVEALGYRKDDVDFIIMQMVRLFEKGRQVRMSKRTGTYLALEELIDEVGLDAVRFFFLNRSPNSHLNFDLDLAKEQSEKNPVYYVQYAYARICSILKKTQIPNKFQISNFKLLNHQSEISLAKQLIRFPEIIEDTAKDYQVQRLPNYALELVAAFHKFYEQCRVLTDDKKLTQARLSLVKATEIVLKYILDLMGISAPEKM